MKELKKKIFAAAAMTIMTVSCALSAFAASPSPSPEATARPRPGASTSASSSSDNSSESSSEKSTTVKQESTAAPESTADTAGKSNDSKAISVTSETAASQQGSAVSNKKYVSRGGAFLWFLLSVIVNALISFAIANRFYKLSKKDNHLALEVRALRRDVEEKFISNVGGFAEPETDISNSNDDYSMNTEGIKGGNKPDEEFSGSAEETFKRWESQLSSQRAQKRAAIRASLETKAEKEERGEEPHLVRSNSYQPRREMPPRAEEPETADDSLDLPEEESKIDSIKSKAKELITDIFPFRED